MKNTDCYKYDECSTKFCETCSPGLCNFIQADGVSDSPPIYGSVETWSCECGYSFHSGVKHCRKCGSPQPKQNANSASEERVTAI
jgi:hypothetical protein